MKSTAMKRIFNRHYSDIGMANFELSIKNAGAIKAFNNNSNSQREFNSTFIDFKEGFSPIINTTHKLDGSTYHSKSNAISENREVLSFYSQFVDVNSPTNLIIEKNEKLSSLSELVSINSVLLLDKINNFRLINKSIEEVNQNLPQNGLLLGSFETFNARAKKRLFSNVPVLKHFCTAFDFIFNRICPKLPYVKKAYFFITKGKNRLLSKAEALGRLVSCGFEIVDVKEIQDVNYFVVKKTKEPAYDMNPSYGPLFKMRRIGKGGKIIGVYKFRTMHPYSEYLQDYVLKLNGYDESGKLANDFRVTRWGRFFRKYWIDELPQLINVIKRDLNLVGVRPLSQTRFNELPEDVRALRIKYRSGCVPPYVSLMMPDSQGNIEAERIYLAEKIKNPIFADLKYLYMALYNILSGKIYSA